MQNNDEILDNSIIEKRSRGLVILRLILIVAGFLIICGIVMNFFYLPYNGYVIACGIGLLISYGITGLIKKLKNKIHHFMILTISVLIAFLTFNLINPEYFIFYSLTILGFGGVSSIILYFLVR